MIQILYSYLNGLKNLLYRGALQSASPTDCDPPSNVFLRRLCARQQAPPLGQL